MIGKKQLSTYMRLHTSIKTEKQTYIQTIKGNEIITVLT